MSLKLKLNKRGDTIVEVLIAIAIISMILAGAYVTSNSSLKTIRRSQERVQAVGYAQSQIESLRANAPTTLTQPGNANYVNAPPAQQFCFDSSGNIAAAGTASCTSGIYTVKIQSLGKTNANYATTTGFQLEVSWPAIGGGNEQLIMVYRVAI